MAAKKTTAGKAGAAEEDPNVDATGVGSSKAAAEKEQFPSTVGKPEVEIAKRSQDVDEAEANEHRKVFVIPVNPIGDDYDDEVHARNIDAMRQGMVLQGLRPTEDGRFVEARPHSDGQSVCLVYACKCVPAAVDEPGRPVRVTVEDQHALEDEERAEAEKNSPRKK